MTHITRSNNVPDDFVRVHQTLPRYVDETPMPEQRLATKMPVIANEHRSRFPYLCPVSPSGARELRWACGLLLHDGACPIHQRIYASDKETDDG